MEATRIPKRRNGPVIFSTRELPGVEVEPAVMKECTA
jgi:hypothetical protein